jgi:hypothetical protein
MMKEGVSNTLNRWDRLLAGVAAHPEDLQCVEACRVQLALELSDIQSLRARQAALRAEMRQSVRALKVLLVRGTELAARIRAGVRSQYGTRSDKLLEFGMNPVRRRKSVCKETP